MFEKMFHRTKLLEKALDASWLRNEVISQNIANVNTPGYKRKSVAFEEYLNQAVKDSGFKGLRTHPGHRAIGEKSLDEIQPVVNQDYSSLSMRLDGNNVDVENETVLMAKNTIQYNVLSQKIASEFQTLRTVIKEGR